MKHISKNEQEITKALEKNQGLSTGQVAKVAMTLGISSFRVSRVLHGMKTVGFEHGRWILGKGEGQ